jgi:hypothetical protein
MSAAALQQLPRDANTTAALDRVLVAQLVVAWAGEGGDEPRMNWWRSDMLAEYGGEDLFQRLLPQTWEWAVLRAVREAARRREAALIERYHDPDRVIGLFNLGFVVDERISDRLAELERAREARATALPQLEAMIIGGWERERFLAWVREHPTPEHEIVPTGRRLLGPVPPAFEDRAQALVGALDPLADKYPVPHFVLEQLDHHDQGATT